MPGVKSEITKEKKQMWGGQMEGKRGRVDEEGQAVGEEKRVRNHF